MAVHERTYTADEFWQLLALPENANRRLELLDGVILEMAPSSALPTLIGGELYRRIANHVQSADLGYVTTAEGGYRLAPKTVLAPDIGFIAKSRVEKLPRRFFTLPPDLVVEVVSPTDNIRMVQRKAARYLALGVREVWLLYPDEQTADIYRPGAEGSLSVQQQVAALESADILPGFQVAIKALFEGLPPLSDEEQPENGESNDDT